MRGGRRRGTAVADDSQPERSGCHGAGHRGRRGRLPPRYAARPAELDRRWNRFLPAGDGSTASAASPCSSPATPSSSSHWPSRVGTPPAAARTPPARPTPVAPTSPRAPLRARSPCPRRAHSASTGSPAVGPPTWWRQSWSGAAPTVLASTSAAASAPSAARPTPTAGRSSRGGVHRHGRRCRSHDRRRHRDGRRDVACSRAGRRRTAGRLDRRVRALPRLTADYGRANHTADASNVPALVSTRSRTREPTTTCRWNWAMGTTGTVSMIARSAAR